jgi:sugar porter (SP) family MFS transporter
MESITYEQAMDRVDIGSGKNIIYAVIAIIAALGGFVWGYDAGIIGTTLIYVTPFFHLSTPEIAILTSGTIGFAAVGALVAGRIVDKMGRKFLLVVDGLIYSVFAILAALSFNAAFLIITRILIGFAIGADGAVATAYVAELSPSKSRGRLTIIQQLMIFSGFTFAFWSGYFLSRTGDWRLMFGLGAVPALILFVLRIYLPESPRWLLINGRNDEASKSFRKLGITLQEGVQTPERESSFRKFIKNPIVKRAVIIMIIIAFLNNATGINVILYFGPTIYKGLGLTGSRAILITAIAESTGAIEYAASFFLIDRLGRRKLSLLGYTGMVASLVVMLMGFYSFLSGNVYAAIIEIFIAMTGFLGFYHFGVGGVFWVLQGETMPTQIRGSAAGILASSGYIGTVFSVFTFAVWKNSIGAFSFFVLELILTIIALIVVYLALPETKNVPLEDVTSLFGRKEISKKAR